jgi:signal transduction histidine kinase
MSANVRCVPPTATLMDAARLLADERISCLVVVEDGRPAGIVSERDVVREAVRDPKGWSRLAVSGVMSHPLLTTELGATVAQAIRELQEHHVRRLPVVTSEGSLAGIVTQSDLLRATYRRLQDYSTELERLVSERTAELGESERRRDDLVDLTVHDIKNSLCIVDSALDMIGQDPLGAASMLPLLRRATARIANLVCTLLEVNRLESGTMPLRAKDVPWSTLCESVLAEAGLMAQAKGIAINRTGEGHSIVHCDPHLLDRVLLNLLDNAISAAPERSVVDVHSECPPDGGFLVRVGNRGRPIAPEILPTLFRKYGRGDEERPYRRFGGWGLGLTFCRLAIERHGGSIRAISPYVDGEGAAFEFTLP